MNKIATLANYIELMGKISAVITAFVIPLSTSLTGIFFILTIALYYLAGGWQEKFLFIVQDRVALYLLLFFACFLVGILYTTAPLSDAISMVSKYDKLLFAVLLLPLFREEKWRNYALNAFLVAIGILLFFSYLKYFGMIQYGIKYGPVEIFKGHIAFNFLMSFAAYVLVYKIIKLDGWPRWALVIFLVLIFYNVFFMTTARSGYAVFAGLMVLFLIQRLRWQGLLVSLISLVVLFGGVFLFSSVFKERAHAIVSDVQEYKTNEVTSIGLRMSFVKNSLQLIKAHPVFGTGTGSFKTEYANIQPPPVVKTHNPHNEYLHIGVQFGVFGLILLLLNFAMQLWNSRLLPEPFNGIAQAVVISIMLGSLANSWLLDTTQGHFYAYFIALTFACLPGRVKRVININ
jgi:O-antigen ligase